MLPGIGLIEQMLNSVDESTLSEKDLMIKRELIKDLKELESINDNDPKGAGEIVQNIMTKYAKFQ